MKGTIFDIKRYAIHDGPGIRTTVFFKGCALRCQWCHNPEGIKKEHEIMLYSSRCASDCWECVPLCPRKAIGKNGTVISVDRKRCDLCGICEDVCAYEAVAIAGQDVSVSDIMREVEKDRIFFEESGGGVTISGGEPLTQPHFLLALLGALNENNIHVAVDTSGFVPRDILDAVSQRADLILYDLKVMDENKHRQFTGESNTLILENLRRLYDKGCDIIIRVPVLVGLNDDAGNIRSMADYLLSMKRTWKINLLPYHEGGIGKSMRLNGSRPRIDFKTPSEKKLTEIKDRLSSHGFLVKIGG